MQQLEGRINNQTLGFKGLRFSMAPCKNYSCVLIGCCSYFDFVLQQAVEMPLSCEISTEKFIRGYQHIFSFHYYAILPHGSIRTRANMSLYYTVEQGKIATESWAHVSHKKLKWFRLCCSRLSLNFDLCSVRPKDVFWTRSQNTWKRNNSTSINPLFNGLT